MKTEYLIVVDGNKKIATSKPTLKSLIASIGEIKFTSKQIEFKQENFDYELKFKNISKTQHISFDLTIKYDDETGDELKNVEVYEELLRNIRIILSNNDIKYEILWDDMSFYRSKQTYPLIYEIENLLRKLLTKFMIVNVGLKWEKDNIPSAIDNSKNKGNQKQNSILYNLDFIQLSNFLFDKYPLKSNTSELQSLLDKDVEEIKSELKDFIPKSNWERYFSQEVDGITDERFKKQWTRLYDLRCKIAHNNTFTAQDFEDVKSIVDELKGKIESAIQNLDKINVNDIEKENVSESYAVASNENLAEFLASHEKLCYVMRQIVKQKLNEPKDIPLRGMRVVTGLLYSNNVIREDEYKQIRGICHLRDKIVHGEECSSYEELEQYILKIKALIDSLSNSLMEEKHDIE